MQITNVKVTPVDNGKIKGYASVTFDEEFVVGGITIFDGEKGLFISMPQRKNKDNEYSDIVYPLTKELRKTLTTSVLDELANQMSKEEPTDKKGKKGK